MGVLVIRLDCGCEGGMQIGAMDLQDRMKALDLWAPNSRRVVGRTGDGVCSLTRSSDELDLLDSCVPLGHHVHSGFLGSDRGQDSPIITSRDALGPYGAVACGAYVSNFMLAAQAHGIASIAQAALSSWPDVVREELQISSERRVLCGISFGYADLDTPQTASVLLARHWTMYCNGDIDRGGRSKPTDSQSTGHRGLDPAEQEAARLRPRSSTGCHLGSSRSPLSAPSEL
ncbi:nitroreductase family protein [Ramlibacter henchirensis]|uniref:nitroreductase family protein n=1 Tax=Ramlibacter henchirensis TaxID=204072 RepID=UPI0030B8CC07